MKKRLIGCSLLLAALCVSAARPDSVARGFDRPLSWRVGVELSPAFVPPTNAFLRGENPDAKRINTSFSGDVRADFAFAPSTRQGMLYHGLYQGLGVGVNSFFASSLLGTPVSAYVYQGAPIVRFNDRLTLGYEWQFGAAFGWQHYDELTAADNGAVSTSVTAHMGVSLKLYYKLSERWQLSVAAVGRHFSNGNTSWPNAGVNTLGGSIGVAYVFGNRGESTGPASRELIADADRGRWFYDIMAYGAWRKHTVVVGGEAELCPGRFGVVGLQFAPMRTLNRFVAVGAALDMQWDEGAGLAPYWVEGSTGDNIHFYRPPFGRQLNVGLSAHAELTMPIFAVNVGLGYDFVSPDDEKRFYQSLSLKTFVTDKLFLNVGYRLGSFKTPQNLMLGIGIRL